MITEKQIDRPSGEIRMACLCNKINAGRTMALFGGLHLCPALLHKKLHEENNTNVISYQFDRTIFEQMIDFSLYIKWYRNQNFFLFSQKNFEKVLIYNQNVTLLMLECIVSCNRNRFRLQSETQNSPQGA